MPVVSACGRWSSFDSRWGVVVVFVVAGGRTRSSRARLLGVGRRLLAVLLFACVCRVVGWLASFWAAGVACGGVGGVTWHAGDMEGTRARVVDAGDAGVWFRVCCLAGCRVLWAAWVVSGGGGYLWAGCWHGALVVDVVVG